PWAKWTGDPLFDNYAHAAPGTVRKYSSGAYVRLGQALTALWDRDLKDVIQEKVLRHIGIPADRWGWLPGKVVHDTKDFYPDIPGYGEYVGPPYKINGHVVRGGPGWVVMSSEDLARFGLLIATGGVWKGKQLVDPKFLPNLQYGVGIHAFAGDADTMVGYAKINTGGFPFGGGDFSFPKKLIVGPVHLKRIYKVIRTPKVKVPMRDGVNLGADIYRPDAPGKFPVLMLLRYFREGADHGKFFARRGYVVALVDSRGRGDSEGKWDSYVNEPKDGYDAQQWLGRQRWSNGKIGTFGISYNAFTQYMPAPLGSPYLKCLFPEEGQQTNFGHLYYDGVMQLNVVFQFGLFTRGKLQTQKQPHIRDPHYLQLPLISAVDKFPDVQHVKDWFKHSRYDEYWKAYGVKEKYPQIKVPAFIMTGWYDNLCHEGWRHFKGFREQGGSEQARTGTKILVGPWAHGGSRSYPGLMELKLRWYDFWLKGIQNGIDKEPPIKIYVMGADKWRTENEWPLARARPARFYIHSKGKANSVSGDGRLNRSPPQQDSPPDKYVYDPKNPVYTNGGQISTLARGPRDRQKTQKRNDILVYTTEPLAEDMEVTGPVEMKLYAASSAVNTDFTATLTDVHPDGKAIHICEGIRGVTFRESLENPTFITPGKVYRYTIDLWETSMVFKRGHRIRLEISSSNFPRFARNQNTDKPFGTSAQIKKARQTILHNAKYPSHLILPVIPEKKKGTGAYIGNNGRYG
ncbi:MAG: CocE/NonD family hydrolase, partial [Phycisphaerae bacterium]|nr:CocE/NonD family hydrolase [Phycisphaerae bacterium]